MKGASTFSFLNRTHELADSGDWQTADEDLLWCYNLHYFDDLTAEAADHRSEWHAAIVDRWIAENPVGHGIGWEPYPLSLRIVNWIKWDLAGHALKDEWRQSLAIQAAYLSKRIEWHLLANHLVANAKALVFAGCFFGGQAADRWLKKGLAILDQQIPEQLLADGGHFERSPMYHAIILEDFLDLINVANAFPDRVAGKQLEFWQQQVRDMITWLYAMSHPDGEISFFNDAAIGVAATPAQLLDYVQRLGVAQPETQSGSSSGHLCHLKESGYIRCQSDDAVALLDVAPIGPDYQPGHAHADTLSFEMSVYGQRVLVNSGTNCYGTGADRQYQRSTRAHNTVVVDREDSSEVWAGFRVARRAYPHGLTIDETASAETVIRCSHNGYQRLPGRVTHQRTWRFSNTSLVVEDELQGRFETGVARFHFHPAVSVWLDDVNLKGQMATPGGETIEIIVEEGVPSLEPSEYYPRFGHTEQNQCLAIAMVEARSKIVFSWE